MHIRTLLLIQVLFFLKHFRQFIARTILDTLRLVTEAPEDVEAVLNVMNKLADDVGKSC